MENAGHHGPGKHWDEQIHDIFWAEYGCERPSWTVPRVRAWPKSAMTGCRRLGRVISGYGTDRTAGTDAPPCGRSLWVSDSTAQSCLGRRRYRFSSHC